MRFFILIFLFLGLASCKKYAFVKKGHFIDGVDEYFNLDQRLNIWLYMDYLGYDGSRGLRMDSLYPKDREIFDIVGLKGRSVQVLFTARPMSRLHDHLAILKHKRGTFNADGYIKYSGKNSYYFYKDFEHDFLIIRHVFIPYGKNKHISMVYYIDKDKYVGDQFKRLTYLADINAMELQKATPFRNFWQVVDCKGEQEVRATIKIRQYLTKGENVIYLKMYTLYENSRGISFAKLLSKDDPDSLSLALCPNSYTIEYWNVHGDLLCADTLHVAVQ